MKKRLFLYCIFRGVWKKWLLAVEIMLICIKKVDRDMDVGRIICNFAADLFCWGNKKYWLFAGRLAEKTRLF